MSRQATIKIDRRGKVTATVELRKGERIMIVSDDAFYKLGGQIDDVVRGHVLLESSSVAWSSIDQEWADIGSPVAEGRAA